MNFTPDSLKKAAEQGIISQKQYVELIDFIEKKSISSSVGLTHILYYLGGLIAIGAMSLFMTLGWESFGGWGIVFLCLGYALAGLLLLHFFQKKGYLIPAGICATFVIFLTPLAIYGFQKGMGWWLESDTVFQDYNFFINWQWMYMELGTLIVGIILFWIYRYPFMLMPIALTLWYMSMDLTAVLTHGNYSFELGALVSLWFGLCFVLVAFIVDIKSHRTQDYAFWLYLFAVITFWTGLTSWLPGNELSNFFYLCINILLIIVGAILNRRIFVVCAGLGICFYLGHLAYSVFKNSFWFPVALTLIGLAIIALGVIWQKHEADITLTFRKILPDYLHKFLNTR